MNELLGIFAAVLSSALGGASVGATRYLAGVLDPFAIGSFRFGIGFSVLLVVAFLKRTRWPERRHWPAIVGLGLLFFFVFPILFNAALAYTTAARGALSLSTLPIMTMLVGVALRSEPLTLRKTVGVMVAMCGVAIALLSALVSAPDGAWKGDILMIAAALCMAFYSVWSSQVMRSIGPIAFTTMAMGVGAAGLSALSFIKGSFAPIVDFSVISWLAVAYLGAIGAALTFYLWSFVLERTTATRVAVSVAVNPVSAAIVGSLLLGEPMSWALGLGIATIFAGIWLAAPPGAKI